MSSGQGWSGTNSAVLNYLRVVGADRDDKDEVGDRAGPFIIGGEGGILSFLGMTGPNADVVIPSDTVYYINAKPVNLALGLSRTSHGLSVYVIC